jgi:anti-sigma regulatory factor (Ser/Thr protein kinase)
MPGTLLLAEDNATSRKVYADMLAAEGYRVIQVEDGSAALDVINSEQIDVLVTGTVIGAFRNRASDLLSKPFSLEELRNSVKAAIERESVCDVEVISATPDWIEIRVPCDLNAVEPIQRSLNELHANLAKETRDAVGSVFRELLNNAIEHGGKCDASKKVVVKYVRLKRAILYSIADPGEGFNLSEIEHAAVANPADNPFRHMKVREQKGLRPGGYGIMLASQVIDELVYNEKHNELIFVKYLDEVPESQ